MPSYELRSLALPKLTGMQLKAFTRAVESPAGQALLLNSLLENGGIPKLRRAELKDAPTFLPLVQPAQCEREAPVGFSPAGRQPDFSYRTASDYRLAYQSGALNPVNTAEGVLAAVEASDRSGTPLRAFIALNPEDLMTQARASAQRWQSGQPLSPLDGVPVAVKDEVDMLPYPTTVGTAFLGRRPADQDASVVARLRAAGALLVGKTNMHEIGIAPNGLNAHYGIARNPFHEECDTGGSSSGSGVAVSAGIVPIAVGADGGGSIRVPASLCGVVGLKPTYGRISEFGAAPLCWSVAHLGPLADCVEDAALAYSIMAGPDPQDPNTLVQPPVTLAGWNVPDLKGLRLGIYPAWFEHASAGIVAVCKGMLEELRLAGAEIREISIPGLDEMRIAHVITILSEMAVCMQSYPDFRKQHALSVRLSLVLGEALTATDYLRAQQVRTRALHCFQEIFQQVDVIISPATAVAAQPIPKGSVPDGWSDLGTDTELMRYAFPGNLAGLPAISFPAGYDERGLPVGMQAMGRHWEENVLLRVAFAAEQRLTRHEPRRFHKVF